LADCVGVSLICFIDDKSSPLGTVIGGRRTEDGGEDER
jgi:hypothetical protein